MTAAAPLEDACDGFSVSAMDWTVRPTGDGTYRLEAEGVAIRCAIGRGGMRADKREGDGATPIGRWALREALFRPDRVDPPLTLLNLTALTPKDGWCDAPNDPSYNRPVRLPFAASHEEMWREDALYDVVVPLGYNDDPPVPGMGSAIFLHICRDDFAPTAGCIAVPRAEILRLLAIASPATHIVVQDS